MAAAEGSSIHELLPLLLARTPELAPPAFRLTHEKTGWLVELCPDGTCDVIRAPGDVPSDTIDDFALLYFYYASNYVYLKNFHLRDARPFIPDVLARHATACPNIDEIVRASCVLRGFASRYSIRLASRRFDEESRWEYAVNIDDAISERRLREVNVWQLDQWNDHHQTDR